MRNFRNYISYILLVAMIVTTMFAVPAFAETQADLESVFATRADWNKWAHGSDGGVSIDITNKIKGGAKVSGDEIVIDTFREETVTRNFTSFDDVLASASEIARGQIEWQTCYEALRRGMTVKDSEGVDHWNEWKDKIHGN